MSSRDLPFFFSTVRASCRSTSAVRPCADCRETSAASRAARSASSFRSNVASCACATPTRRLERSYRV
eukprot:1195343-Prorocentrum_minimum.AAC.3